MMVLLVLMLLSNRKFISVKKKSFKSLLILSCSAMPTEVVDDQQVRLLMLLKESQPLVDELRF